MKNFLAKLSELQKMLLLGGVVSLFLLLLSLIQLFVASQTGWLIGVAIGCAVEMLSIFLLYKGSEMAMTNLKAWQFLLCYFLRMFLFLVGMIVAAMFSYGFFTYVQPIPAFKYALWGVLIGYAPMQIIVIGVLIAKKKSPITISEQKEDKDE